MAINVIEINGFYQNYGIVLMDHGYEIDLSLLLDKKEVPKVPYGTKIKIIVKYENIDLLNGVNGIVWATYNYTQAETIKNALFIQDVFGEIIEFNLNSTTLYKIHIGDLKKIGRAIDFIWRDNNGLRLKPDWHYRKDEINNSFQKWLNGE